MERNTDPGHRWTTGRRAGCQPLSADSAQQASRPLQPQATRTRRPEAHAGSDASLDKLRGAVRGGSAAQRAGRVSNAPVPDGGIRARSRSRVRGVKSPKLGCAWCDFLGRCLTTDRAA